ncbi:DUF7287 family protein [Methanocella arvoryzae]|uniref:Uncharacterized protein n=1 Tax=Methanocella arvoryzae (strain DSM 22066 / NBRC 105507 / MRE50) TaxID=351160 RepID=Q0W744_METAR|nr:hypothetical protein [Methanocella arvoryzae]CAJ35799.1 hypothetical protein RCIX347 [Methanocella arvoryzae MRE50]
MKRLIGSSDGQISLDYLVGITVFLMAFIFVFAFIPGMFTPFHSNSDELTMTADRVAATLIQDTLAVNNSTTKLPGVLDAREIANFNAVMNSPDNKTLRENLGLNSSGNALLLYNLQVTIQADNQPTININHGQLPGNGNVGQSKRFVMIRDANALPDGYNGYMHATWNFFNEDFRDRYPGRMAIVTVRVW